MHVDHFLQAQSYVGTPYRVGEFDCADLAVQVQQQVFGRSIALPQNRPRPGGLMTQAQEIRRWRDDLADKVPLAVTGCGVLLSDRAANGQMLWHIGTVFVQAEVAWVLHNSAKLGSAALQRLTDLERWGLQVEGFYAWRHGDAA